MHSLLKRSWFQLYCIVAGLSGAAMIYDLTVGVSYLPKQTAALTGGDKTRDTGRRAIGSTNLPPTVAGSRAGTGNWNTNRVGQNQVSNPGSATNVGLSIGNSGPSLFSVPLRTLGGKTLKWMSVAYSEPHKLLASGGSDRLIRLWDPAAGTLLRTFSGHTRTCRGPPSSTQQTLWTR